MARDEFFDNLRHADQMLTAPHVNSGLGRAIDTDYSKRLHSADLWLTAKAVEGFDPADFRAWPREERERLVKEVAAFLEIASRVAPDKPATKSQSENARRHLKAAIEVVGRRLQQQWLSELKQMEHVAATAAKEKSWYVDSDEKEISESLLGTYKAPRIRIRTPDHEVVLVPGVRFGSGRQGLVDLMVLPSYERAYVVAFKSGEWQIVSLRGTQSKRPFNPQTLVNTITRLPRC